MEHNNPRHIATTGAAGFIKMARGAYQRNAVVPVGYFLLLEEKKGFLRKEVIQPQVPLRLPCYDLVPIRSFAFDADAALGAPSFRGLTGGLYKAQEHIHRSVADLRLLAIPASCGRVAAHNLN